MAAQMETSKNCRNNLQSKESKAKTIDSQVEVAQKIKSGEYKLLRRDQRSTVWKVYRVIIDSEGTPLRSSFFCTGCNRVLKSSSGNTSNLRIHICHVKYMRKLLEEKEARNAMEQQQKQKQDANQDHQLEYTQAELRKQRFRKNNPTRHEWCANGTKMLLQLWATYIDDLRGKRKNSHVHREMAQKMKHFGANAVEVKAKMDNLTKKYRKEANDVKLSGRPSKWEHFYRLQSLLIGTKAVDLSNDFTFNSRASTDDDKDAMESETVDIDETYAEEDNSQDGLVKEEEEEDDYISDNVVENIEVSPVRPSLGKYAKPSIAREMEMTSERPPLEDYEEELDKQNLTIEQKYKAKRKRKARLLEIEEEKLAIEREKLKTMKYLKQELSSFHKDMFRLLSHDN